MIKCYCLETKGLNDRQIIEKFSKMTAFGNFSRKNKRKENENQSIAQSEKGQENDLGSHDYQ